MKCSAKIKAAALFCAILGANLPIYAQNRARDVSVQSVQVLVDNINEEGISLQVLGMAKNAFNSIKIDEKTDEGAQVKKYTIKIDLRERSFYKSVDNIHSLYARYQLFSEDGECVLENIFCSEGRKSILSALVQQRQVAKIARDLKKYFESDA